MATAKANPLVANDGSVPSPKTTASESSFIKAFSAGKVQKTTLVPAEKSTLDPVLLLIIVSLDNDVPLCVYTPMPTSHSVETSYSAINVLFVCPF